MKRDFSVWKDITKMKGVDVYKIFSGLQNEYSVFLKIWEEHPQKLTGSQF